METRIQTCIVVRAFFIRLPKPNRNILLLYTNRQSFLFHTFHWWRAYHVRLTKSNLESAREGDNALFMNNEKNSRAPSREHATFGQLKRRIFCELKLDLFYRIKITVF